jgi:hypothetical protein
MQYPRRRIDQQCPANFALCEIVTQLDHPTKAGCRSLYFHAFLTMNPVAQPRFWHPGTTAYPFMPLPTANASRDPRVFPSRLFYLASYLVCRLQRIRRGQVGIRPRTSVGLRPLGGLTEQMFLLLLAIYASRRTRIPRTWPSLGTRRRSGIVSR